MGQKWHYAQVEDPRAPGVKFHFLIDDPRIGYALQGKPLPGGYLSDEELERNIKKFTKFK